MNLSLISALEHIPLIHTTSEFRLNTGAILQTLCRGANIAKKEKTFHFTLKTLAGVSGWDC